jgi:hypothetical protein
MTRLSQEIKSTRVKEMTIVNIQNHRNAYMRSL